tara:strand:- start:932 stop:1654 length:723 start_codon:yes stop_codon:yes gene_type:complete
MENSENKFDFKLVEKLFLDSSVEISLASFVTSLIAAAILSYLIKRSYVAYSQSLSNRDYFSDVFIPLSVITCLVISVVKFSLALSLGLVGALSIVRFRAAIKEPEELVYLFFCVAIGIATGANQIIVATASTLIVIFILYIQSIFKKRKEKDNINYGSNNILKVNITNKKISAEEIIKKYEKYTTYLNLKSSFFEKNISQHVFWIEFKNKKSYLECLRMSEKLPNEGVEISLYSNSKIIE